MSTPLIIKYPFDPTGQAFSNAIQDEQHVLPRNRNRAFALNAGPFYADSLVLRTIPGDVELTEGTDYRTLYLYEYYTRKTGMTVVAVVHVFNEDIQGTVSAGYQVVGGEASSNTTAIQQLIQSLEIDNRGIVFDDLIDLPVTWPPSPHLHHVGDWYGMEEVVDVLQDILTAMENGSGDIQLEIIRQRVTTLEQSLVTITARMQSAETSITDLNGRVVANESDITALQQLIVSVQSSIVQINARLNQLEANRNYVIVTTAVDMVQNKSYYFAVGSLGTLPNIDTVPLGAAIKVSHAFSAEPTYRVFDTASESIVYKDNTDTSVAHDVKESAIIVKTASRQWSIFV